MKRLEEIRAKKMPVSDAINMAWLLSKFDELQLKYNELANSVDMISYQERCAREKKQKLNEVEEQLHSGIKLMRRLLNKAETTLNETLRPQVLIEFTSAKGKIFRYTYNLEEYETDKLGILERLARMKEDYDNVGV